VNNLESNSQPNTLSDKDSVIGSLSKSEKQVIKLLEKIDEISKNKDFKAYLFGQAGYYIALLKNPTKEQIDFESKKEIILNERVIWKSNHILGDGGDADFR
jgi:hypothetical protein